MVQILGANGKIIVGILCVYYWEINAELQILEYWKPNPQFDMRRNLPQKKDIPASIQSNSVLRFNQNERLKYTRGSRATHFPRLREQSNKDRIDDYSYDENNHKHTYNMARNRQLEKNHDSLKKAILNNDRNDNYKMEQIRKVNKNVNVKNKDPKTAKTNNNSINAGQLKKQINNLKTQTGRGRSVTTSIRTTKYFTPMYLRQEPAPEETPAPEQKEANGNGGGEVTNYINSYSVAAQMTKFLEEFTTANASIEVLGRTAEYNDIVILKVTAKTNENGTYFRAASKYMDESPEKKIIFIVHGLSVMGMKLLPQLGVVANEMKSLLHYYLNFLDKFDIFIIPLANPDGCNAERASSFWNKNMSPQESCPGVALDRNFDVATNSSRKINSCSQLYPGPSPFSETETKAVRDVFHHFGHKIIAYIHVHGGTYNRNVFKGDAILYPKGYSESQSDDDRYIDVKGEIDEAMKNASFQVMSVTVDTLYNWYGKVTGSSVDYASTVYGIPYAFEFVMQPYDFPHSKFALEEIWSRLIKTTFNNIWKNQNHVNDKK